VAAAASAEATSAAHHAAGTQVGFDSPGHCAPGAGSYLLPDGQGLVGTVSVLSSDCLGIREHAVHTRLLQEAVGLVR
jgi:hypothetical protein